jgi:hypothetical protein
MNEGLAVEGGRGKGDGEGDGVYSKSYHVAIEVPQNVVIQMHSLDSHCSPV